MILDSAGTKVIARVLVSGPASLYSINDAYYHLRKNGDEGIFFTRKIENATSSNAKITSIKRIGTIKMYLDDCLSGVRPPRLQEDDLIRFVRGYNRCKDPGYVTPKRKSAYRLSPVAGLTVSTTSLSDGFLYSTYSKSSFRPSLSFHTGLGFEIAPQSYTARTVVNVSILYQKSSFHSESEYNSPGPIYYNTKMEYSVSTLRMPITFRLYFGHGQQGVFIAPGISPYLILQHSSSSHSTARYLETDIVKEESDDDIFDGSAIRNTSIGFLLSMGYSKNITPKNKLSLSISAESDVGMLGPKPNSTLKERLNNYYLTARYTF